MTVFDHLRARLERQAGITPLPPPRYTLAQLSQSEWSPRFEELMRNRLIMGALRYGLLNSPGKKNWDRETGIRKRLAQYTLTGNLECPVDVANLALLEFEEGRHPNRHFSAFDGDHSCM